MNIGFVGYSGTKFDEKKAKDIINKIFDEIDGKYKKHGVPVKIVSGATLYGIPKLVYYEAVKRGYKTVGVMCKHGWDTDNGLFPVDELYTEGNNWGDESDKFIGMLDDFYKIGGGKQSIKELQMAKDKGIPTHEYELEAIK
jgi:hypothetical protein